MSKTDCLIIGGGAVGMCAALSLAGGGLRVTLADAGFAKASWAGGGILSPLPPWEYSPALNKLSAQGAMLWRRFAKENPACEWWRCGLLAMPPNDETRFLQWQQAGGKAKTRADGKWLATVAQIRPPRALAVLAEKLKSAGIAQKQATVKKLKSKNGRIESAQLDNGDCLSAAVFVVCCGARSALVCPRPPPSIRPRHGQISLYRPPPHFLLSHILFSARDNFYLIPRRDGLLLAGTTDSGRGFNAQATAAGGRKIHRLLTAHCPQLAKTKPQKSWGGLRPTTADGAPIMDCHPRFKNLFINGGHGRYGFTMAPAAAKIITRHITHGKADNRYPYR